MQMLRLMLLRPEVQVRRTHQVAEACRSQGTFFIETMDGILGVPNGSAKQ